MMTIRFLLKNKMVCAGMVVFAAAILTGWSASAAVTQTAVVALSAGDYSSGAHAVVSVDPVGGPRNLQQDLAPSGSDLTVVAHGKYFYRMERSGANNITKFDINSPAAAVWQFSTEGSETGSNLHDLVFLSDTKAYLLRYGSPILWIVNPSATTEAEFKIGEINLSAYSDHDGAPEMNSGVIVNGLLYVTLQRIDFSGGWGNFVYNTPYVAVFDTANDTEKDTGQGNGTLMGIPLPMENPGAIQYLEANTTIYVQGIGQYTAQYTSGIAAINPATYEAMLILDDGDDTAHPYGAIAGMVMVSPTKGYFVGYAGWGDNTLYAFDPSASNPVGTAVPGLANLNISGMETGAYVDQNNMLWVCSAAYDDATWSLIEPKIIVLNTEDDTVDETIETNLNPLKVVFVQEGAPGSTASDEDSDSGCFITAILEGGE